MGGVNAAASAGGFGSSLGNGAFGVGGLGSAPGGGSPEGGGGSGISANSIDKIIQQLGGGEQPNVVQSPGFPGNSMAPGAINWPSMHGASGRGRHGGAGGASGGQAGTAKMKQMLAQQNQPGFAMTQGPTGPGRG